jgi:hypothetical protein
MSFGNSTLQLFRTQVTLHDQARAIFQRSAEYARAGYLQGRKGRRSRTYVQKAFRFDAQVCAACPLRAECVRARRGKGTTVTLHLQERLLQEAGALQDSSAFKEYQHKRQAGEHCLARLVH